jgi:hypothetical protein
MGNHHDAALLHRGQWIWKETPMRFEILRLSDIDGSTTDRLIADAETVRAMVEDAAVTGERLYIRPYQAS